MVSIPSESEGSQSSVSTAPSWVFPSPDTEDDVTSELGSHENGWEDVCGRLGRSIEPVNTQDALKGFEEPPRELVQTPPPTLRQQKVSKGKLDEARPGSTSGIYVHSASKVPTALAPNAPPQPAPSPTTVASRDEVSAALRLIARSALSYTKDALSSIFIKSSLVLVLLIGVASLLAAQLRGQTPILPSPFCLLPGMPQARFCLQSESITPKGSSSIVRAEYPRMVEIQNKAFGELLENNVGGNTLARMIKKSARATKDLVVVVRMSDLQSADALAKLLQKFADDAEVTGKGLMKLNAKINGALDSILAESDRALKAIETLPESSVATRVTTSIWPFAAKQGKKDAVADLFAESLSNLSRELERVAMSADASLADLYGLEEALDTIHNIIVNESKAAATAAEECLSDLWTRLGGNRAQLRRFLDIFDTLKSLRAYRQAAVTRVVGALQTLGTLSVDLEELRTRASEYELTGSAMTLERHARAIRAGVDRLNMGRARAEQLSHAASEQAFLEAS